MLVLSRRRNESLLIGDMIEVVMLEIRSDIVRLGIVAPAELAVQRREDWLTLPRDRLPPTLPAAKLAGPGLVRGGPMRVFARQRHEALVLNSDITVVVIDIRGDKVRLGIESPREIPPYRREVYEAIRRNEATGLAGNVVA